MIKLGAQLESAVKIGGLLSMARLLSLIGAGTRSMKQQSVMGCKDLNISRSMGFYLGIVK